MYYFHRRFVYNITEPVVLFLPVGDNVITFTLATRIIINITEFKFMTLEYIREQKSEILKQILIRMDAFN